MDKIKNGAEEIYLAPETESSEELVLDEYIEEVENEDVPVVVEAEPKKNVQVSEILDLRESNRKVYRMSDGTEQAVFYPETVHVFNDDTKTFDDVDNTIVEEEDGRHFVCGKNHFKARFSREEENDELFSIESGMHRVTVSAKKNKKRKNHGVKPHVHKKNIEGFERTDMLVFEAVQDGADYEYSVTGNGVKENIVVKEKADVYRYPFVLHMENVTAEFDETNKRVAFISNENGEEVFFIPAPFMTDANGIISTAVTYELKNAANGDAILTVTPDSEWMNIKYRSFPVVIDPQIQLSSTSGMSTYSWDNGYLYSSSLHTIGTVGIGAASYEVSTMCDTGSDCEGSSSNTMSTAIELSFNNWQSGTIACSGDEVWYKFAADAADAHVNGGTGKYTIYTQGSLDTMGYLYDANGCLIASNDDCSGYNFGITANLTYKATYYVRVRAYSSNTGNYTVGVTYTNADSNDCDDSGNTGTGTTVCYSPNRMYMSFNMPTLPRNPRIKKAELKFFQASGVSECGEYAKLGLYQVNDEICTGFCTPYNDSNLVDFAKMQIGHCEEGTVVSYSFDVTTLVDKINKGESYYPKLVLKMIDESYETNNYVSLYGSAYSGDYAPQFIVTYESTYGVNTSYRTHTHELGRFGQGSIDLQCGNLMFESEDFAWAGNRMPVTIKHLYNSALYAYQYTANSAIKLSTANFSAMKLGLGYKLNIMQSMMATTFQHEGERHTGYVYIGENGEETYFKKSAEQVCCDSNSQCYNLYEDVISGDMLYDPVELTLKQGEETYQFDSMGRLIQIKDAAGNHMDITYTSNRITSVIDGAGRDFSFAYNSSGFLTSITAPDETSILYTYSGNLLSTITYQDGKQVSFTYSSSKPTAVTLLDANGNNVYKVAYSYSGNRLYSVTEYGVENGAFVQGAKSTYSYSVASGRTIVQTTEQMDAEEGECYDNVIKTVYTFDDKGNIVSEYVYSEDTGNTGVEGEESGIHPHSGDGGAGIVSNINNLLIGHNFENLSYWSSMPCNCSGFTVSNYSNDSYSKFGGKTCWIRNYGQDDDLNGIYQVSNTLPAGEYTFSVYAKIDGAFSGSDNPGVFIRVTDTSDNVLAESERLTSVSSEYIRLIAPFEIASAQSVKVEIMISGRGSVDVDGAQLENNPYANAYNMLENGNFERSSGWSYSSGVSYTSGTRFNMSRSLMMTGNLESECYARQNVTVKKTRSTRETFTLSGWAKGYGLPNHEREGITTPTFRLRAVVKYNDTYYHESGEEVFTADFSPCAEEWQFASVQFAKTKYRTIENIKVYCDYDHNIGTAYFDDIQLVRNSLETGLSASDFVVESTGESEGNTETTDTTPTFNEAKDKFGNALTETTFTDGEFGTIYRAFGFTPDCNCVENAGNDLVSETDARGNKVLYTVDEDTSRNEEVTDRCGNKTAYEYDASGKTTKVTSKDAENTELANVSYAYDVFDNMTEIVRGDGMKYVLAYNAYHNLESIGVDGKDEKLVQYTYKTGNGRLKEIAYANGDKMKATYNGVGQMVAEKWYNSLDELTAHYKYVYDGQGNIVRSIDILGQKEYNYEYDAGKVVRATESDIVLSDEMVVSKSLVSVVNFYYNADGELTRKTISVSGSSARTVYYETTDDNTVVKFPAGGKTITSHSKTDTFGRKSFDELQLGTGFVSRQFHYHAGVATEEHVDNNMLKSSPTTQLVSQIVLSGGRTISYEYDEEERITKVDDSVDGITTYTYDALGQLVTETVNGITTKFEYDNYGNILAKGVVDETGEIAEETKITYAYGDDTWKDLLTAYNGQSITYDKQGNPTSYLGHTLTWEKGRQLKSFDDIQYTYNANGIRTSKTVDGIKHTYTLDGTKILREECDGNTLIPLYDNEETVCGILYNNEPYYFQKNLQGDIIGIVDKGSKVVANYTYDAWGVPTIIQDSTDCGIAQINPYRYRGYYFDGENGMYYLQTRYYNPSVCRFINSDEAILLGASETILGCNLITYCENSSLSLSDSFGTDAYWITDTKTLAGLGHSSLLVYTNNAWYYFYFGAKQFLKPFNGPANVIFEKVGITFIKNRKFDYSKLNKRLKGQDGNKIFTGSKKYQGNGYDKSVYIRGDFTSTYRYVNNTVKRMKYNLLKENCSWLCIEILRNSSISSSKKQKLENLQYRYTFKYVRISKYTMTGMWRLVKISNTLIPSTVHKRIVSIFA